ncbi:helix-turn-helix domain-containing protein [Flavobacterium psychrotrophum]|uniref:helix-turn-helix domain-containing protein n=1 Tax=Flavobacterium psychrotrophum TaxID=2294119 RepID=UPI000E320C94|nr:helix-turn-helix domain-containing protein [Flavobacterium psychrotrophum]
MKPTYIDIKSISEVHKFYNCGKPKHPLITVIDLAQVNPDRPAENVFYRTDFYSIVCKRFEGAIKYGKSYYDFDEGSLMFTLPGQVILSEPGINIIEGWGIFFHQDLLVGTELGRKISDYSFFQYSTSEALHISEAEKLILQDTINKIKTEYSQNTDKHTKSLIVDNLQLILNYCNRFYDRQFYTREKVSNDIVKKFEGLLIDYFKEDNLTNDGIPTTKYFASRLNLSSNYLSDVLTRFTGKTTQEHIHLKIIDMAKITLYDSTKSISEIAYSLGFEHPSHFTKLFKNKTGISPREYRNLN